MINSKRHLFLCKFVLAEEGSIHYREWLIPLTLSPCIVWKSHMPWNMQIIIMIMHQLSFSYHYSRMFPETNIFQYLITAWTVVNSLGEFLTRDVNINSNLEANFASTHNAWVLPRSLLFAFLMFTEIIEFKPMLKLIFEFAWAIHRMRRLVTISEPLSPLFPLVSSTELMESMTFSPLLQANNAGLESNRSSLSCQIYSTGLSLEVIVQKI